MQTWYDDTITDLAAYIAEVREGMRAGGEVWALQHIQKTAGTSIVADLQLNDRIRTVNVHLAPEDFVNATPDTFEKVLYRYEPNIMQPDVEFVTGHFRRKHLEMLQAMRPVRLFTFVRDPLERVLSSYRYQRSAEHPPHEKFKRDFPELEVYASHPVSQNSVAKMICSRGDLGDLDESMRRFAFIGVADRYDLSFRLMTAFMRSPRGPKVHDRKSDKSRDTADTISAEARETIVHFNQADRRIWEQASAVLARLEPQIEALPEARGVAAAAQ